MTYTIHIFRKLKKDCVAIRTTVFIQEQGFHREFDEIDANAWHILIYDGDAAIATARLYTEDGMQYHIGRVAVLPKYRGKHVGQLVVSALERQAEKNGGISVSLSAQFQAAGFYEKLGYTKTSDVYMDEFCPHITMTKQLSSLRQ